MSKKARKARASDEKHYQFRGQAAYADPAPGQVILLVNPRVYIKEEDNGKDADGNTFKTDPEIVK